MVGNKKKRAIRDWDIGSSSAENDANLPLYFFKSWIPYEKAISFQNNVFFLKGRTGAGKSAILQQIIAQNSHSPDTVVVNISPDDFFLSKHAYMQEILDFTASTEHPEFAYKILWNLVIAGECLRALRGVGCNEVVKAPRLAENIAYKFLRDAGVLESRAIKMTDKVVSLLRLIRPHISVETDGITAQGHLFEKEADDKTKETHSLLRDCRDIIDYILPELLGARSMYILLDDLDLGWENKESDNLLLRSLAQCLLRFSRIDNTIKPLAAIRTNIFLQIGMYQTEKMSDYIVQCRWDKQAIKKVIEKRLAHKFETNEDNAISEFFDIRVSIGDEKKKNTFDYLYERTLGRPRDMIKLVTECLKTASTNGHSKITPNDILEATAKYSEERAISLIEEWRYNYPELGKIFNLFAQKDTSGNLKIKYYYEEMWDLLAHGYRVFDEDPKMQWYYSYIDDDMTQLILLLFDLGIISIRIAKNQPIVHSYTGSLNLNPNLGSTFYISPCFRSYLETLLPAF